MPACNKGGDGPNDTIDAGNNHPGPDAEPPPADASVVPIFRNPVDLPDDELATQALKLLGEPSSGGPANCVTCHTLSANRLRQWSSMAKSSMTGCLTDLSVASPQSAKKMLDCLRVDAADPSTPFIAERLGPLSTAAHLDWFKYVFETAYGAAAGATELATFRMHVGMPQGTHAPFTQAEFDIVAEWFLRGVPKVDELVVDEPPPPGCTENISAEVGAHVTAMKTAGWSAVNAENGMLMFGCAGASGPLGCLASYPRASTLPIGAGWEALPGATLRVLRTNSYRSSYWTRSSPDGRFVAHGARSNSFGAAVVDLKLDRVIPADAQYDPGFFPDSTGFVFRTQNRAYFCPESLLTGGPLAIHFNEPGCTTATIQQIGLYQHVGAALGGGDYWTVDSEFHNDDGGRDVTIGDPSTDFGSGATVHLLPMIHSGNSFTPGNGVTVATPFEGDFVMSESASVLVSRLAGPGAVQKAFVMRKVVATPDGAGGYTAQVPEVARYCMRGGKPNFSFDERWMVLHHYVDSDSAVNLGFPDANDPGFQPYLDKGASNIFLVDTLTGARTRITMMKPGQYALYPHFRSDGWIYFIVRTPGVATEYVMASDAALVLSQ